MLKASQIKHNGPCGKTAWPVLFALALILTMDAPSWASSAEELVGRAEQMRLYEEPAWTSMLFYQPSLILRRQASMIDDPAFFLSIEGKHDPRAELDATLRAMFSAEAAGDKHPQCRFPARFMWIRERLGVDASEFPHVECPELDEFMAKLRPYGVTLIFPEGAVNNPATMYGHTLLRIDTPAESKLAAYAINYSAYTDETFGPAFAVKGLVGLYNGYFSYMPYYTKLNEYSLIESRDIWEYQLNLTPEETRRLTLHVWEMKEIASDYYFLDENCSYVLLFLLDSVRPEAALVGHAPPWVIPSDTIRAIIDAGMVNSVMFRPSLKTRILFMTKNASPEASDMALRVANGNITPAEAAGAPSGGASGAASDTERIRTLDIASDYLKYRFAKKDISTEAYTARYIETLTARSKLPMLNYDIPTPPHPEDGHPTARVGAEFGVADGDTFAGLHFKGAYHDLLDNDAGYKPGAAITFLDADIREFTDTGRLTLDHLTFVEIFSIAPYEKMFRSISWRVHVGLDGEPDPGGGRRLPLVLRGAWGLATSLMDGRALPYAMAGGAGKLGGAMDKGYAIGGEALAGVLMHPAPKWKAQLQASAWGYVIGEEYRGRSLEFNNAISLSRDKAFRLTLKRSLDFGAYSSEGMAEFMLYF